MSASLRATVVASLDEQHCLASKQKLPPVRSSRSVVAIASHAVSKFETEILEQHTRRTRIATDGRKPRHGVVTSVHDTECEPGRACERAVPWRCLSQVIDCWYSSDAEPVFDVVEVGGDGRSKA